MTEDIKETYLEDLFNSVMQEDEDKFKEASTAIRELPISDRIKILEDLVEKLKDEEAPADAIDNFKTTVTLLKLLKEEEENSSDVAAKEDTKAEEVAQDATSDSTAEAVKVSESEAPAEEEKTEKSEQ